MLLVLHIVRLQLASSSYTRSYKLIKLWSQRM